MQTTRIAPAWFVRKLKAIDSRLSVFWNDRLKRWTIAETVSHANRVGRLGEDTLYRVIRKTPRVFYCEDLGSRVLEAVRRLDMRRFSSMDQMIQELQIDDDGKRPTYAL